VSKVLIADQVEEIVMTKMRALFVLMALVLLTPATVRADTITTGTICDNACFWWRPGDNTPDYLGLFGPVFGDLTGQPFTLDISATGYSLTINSHTLTFGLNDPHYSISFTDPLLTSFAPGAVLFQATGANPFGIAVAEAEFLCDPPPRSRHTRFLLAFPDMLFDQCRACGKDRGKGEKQAANDGAEAGRDEACDYGHRPAEHESDEILVPARLTKGGRLELNDHES
jgi:hypothetical protein